MQYWFSIHLSVTYSLSACDDSRHVPRTSDYKSCPVFHEAPIYWGLGFMFLVPYQTSFSRDLKNYWQTSIRGFTLALGVKERLLLAFVADFLFNVI